MEIVKSVNNVPIRLTAERWFHIIENHTELAGMMFSVLGTIVRPDFIVRGWEDELLAARKMNRHYLIVVYKEVNKEDGFVITAFITSKINQIKQRGIVWPNKKS